MRTEFGRMTRGVLMTLAIAAAGCGEASSDVDSGAVADGGSLPVDAGAADASQGQVADAGDMDASPASDAATTTPDAGSADAATGDGDAGLTTGDAGEPTFTIHIAATTAAFPHSDGYSGQNARNAFGGDRSISLLRDENDQNPVELFDLGQHPVEVGYNDGDITLVATVPTSKLVAGHFTLGRMVQAYSRYDVDATDHILGISTDGYYHDLLVMSDDTFVDGELHNAGYYNFVFNPVDGTPETYTGDGWLIPVWSSTAGAWAVVEDGEWAVYFPIDLDVVPAQWAGADMNILVNMDHSFRWIDNDFGVGYRSGVWDVELPFYETVMRFGGNQFDVSVTGPLLP